MLETGQEAMHVPVYGGDILMQSKNRPLIATKDLGVGVKPGEVTIERLDGLPINVAWVRDQDNVTGEVKACEHMLERPIGSVVLRQVRPNSRRWQTDLELSPSGLSIFRTFLKLVAFKAYKKQNTPETP